MMSQVRTIQNLELDGLASVEKWHKFLKDNSKDSLPIIMVANKIDKINERYSRFNLE